MKFKDVKNVETELEFGKKYLDFLKYLTSTPFPQIFYNFGNLAPSECCVKVQFSVPPYVGHSYYLYFSSQAIFV